MTYTITENELQTLAKILEETPWKFAQPAMELLKAVVQRNQLEEQSKKDEQE